MTHTHFTNGMRSPESERRLVGFAANMTAPEAPDGAEVVKARGDGDLYETMRKNVEHLQKDDKIADREKLIAQYTKAALADLKKSVEQGFEDFAWMKKDPDLKVFQELPEFKKLAEPAENPANAP